MRSLITRKESLAPQAARWKPAGDIAKTVENKPHRVVGYQGLSGFVRIYHVFDP